MLDWIFEGIVTWISSVVSDMMDAVSGLFLQALGTDMTAMEEYFPFVSKAFTVMQYTAWALLFLITVWQLFCAFGGPVTEAENPWVLLGRSALFAFLIGYAKPIFLLTLKIATAPYTALMDIQMTAEDFTFAGIEQALQNGLTSLIATISVVGLLLLTILEIALGWNYFKLLLETVERYIVVGVLCYTSPLAFSMGASKATTPVFRSWCRMVGSQLLLLVMNVWFLRGFANRFKGNSYVRDAVVDGPHAVVNASDGSQWYQMASGSGAGAFYDAPVFSGNSAEAAQVAAAFRDADGATLRTIGDGVIGASSNGGVSRWYNSAYYDEPDAPHSTIQASNGVEWYAMQQYAETPPFEAGDAADGYNRAQFQSFMPGYEQPVTSVDGSGRMDGHFEVRHENGSGTMFYDTSQYAPPRGDYQVYEDVHGSQWYAVHGEAAVERKPVYENGKPVYDGENVRTVSTETVRYKSTPSRYGEPKSRDQTEIKSP